MADNPKTLLNRALRLARLIVASESSLRYDKRKREMILDELRGLCRRLAGIHGMPASSVWDQVMREAYRLPILDRTRATWKRKGDKWRDTDYRFKGRYENNPASKEKRDADFSKLQKAFFRAQSDFESAVKEKFRPRGRSNFRAILERFPLQPSKRSDAAMPYAETQLGSKAFAAYKRARKAARILFVAINRVKYR